MGVTQAWWCKRWAPHQPLTGLFMWRISNLTTCCLNFNRAIYIRCWIGVSLIISSPPSTLNVNIYVRNIDIVLTFDTRAFFTLLQFSSLMYPSVHLILNNFALKWISHSCTQPVVVKLCDFGFAVDLNRYVAKNFGFWRDLTDQKHTYACWLLSQRTHKCARKWF